MKQSKVIGITGGIGAGKSRVLRYLSENYSLDLLEADRVGAELMLPGGSVYEALVREYGRGILKQNGEIDKAALSGIAFATEESQKKINDLEHPLICDEILRRIRNSRYKYILLEAALLKEGGLIPYCEEVWVVRADREVRVERLMSARSYTREKCEAIFKLQLTDDDFSALGDVIIENGRDFSETKLQLDLEMNRLGIRKRRAEACR